MMAEQESGGGSARPGSRGRGSREDSVAARTVGSGHGDSNCRTPGYAVGRPLSATKRDKARGPSAHPVRFHDVLRGVERK